MMRPHRRLSTREDDVCPMALLAAEPETIKQLWREHIDMITGPLS